MVNNRTSQAFNGGALIVERAAELLPDSVATPYFTVTGRVLITQIVGEVVVGFDATGMNLKLIANPTVGADVDMCAVVAVASDVAGNLYTITGTLANAMISTVSGAVAAQDVPILVTAGTIDLSNDATEAANTGSTKWTVHYIPLDEGSIVETA